MGKRRTRSKMKQGNFHFKGEGRAKMFFNRIDKEKSQINRKYQIGERIICNLPHNDGTSKKRPVLIWGQYFDQHGTVIGFDILKLTTKIKQYRPDTFTFNQTGYLNEPMDKKQASIDCGDLLTLSIPYFDTKRKLSHLNPIFIPDIILRRAQSLVFNPSLNATYDLDIKKARRREGFHFEDINSSMIKSGLYPTDVPGHRHMKYIDTVMPLNCDLTQENINHIVKQSITYTQKCMDDHLHIKWPEHGSWPNWPDIGSNKESTPSCLSKEANEHFTQEYSDQEIHAPQLGITSQTKDPITPSKKKKKKKKKKKDNQQKMTAAQKHAKKFANFTI